MKEVRVKMELEFWFNPETQEYRPISSKVIEDTPKNTVKPAKVTKSSSKTNIAESSIILEENKIIFSQEALDLLDAKPEDRVSIKYQKTDGVMQPVIAKDEVFGTKGGNKITKSGTVSFRGKANEKLAEYGNEFNLILKDPSGIYILDGGNAPKSYNVVDSNINVMESEDDHDLESMGLDIDLGVEDSEEIDFNITL